MKISNRELILTLATLTVVLVAFTYVMGGSKIAEQREMALKKVRLKRQILLDQRILEEKNSWMEKLDTLQTQLPVYGRKVSPNIILPGEISEIAARHGLNPRLTQPEKNSEIGSLSELSVRCEWTGTLDALVHFLYDLHEQGIRFDVRQIDIKPVTKVEGQLKGSMIINCAYRQERKKN